MSTFVRTSSHSQFLESVDEHLRWECKPGIKSDWFVPKGQSILEQNSLQNTTANAATSILCLWRCSMVWCSTREQNISVQHQDEHLSVSFSIFFPDETEDCNTHTCGLPCNIAVNISLMWWQKVDALWITLMLCSNVTMSSCCVTLYHSHMFTAAFAVVFCYTISFKCGSAFNAMLLKISIFCTKIVMSISQKTLPWIILSSDD